MNVIKMPEVAGVFYPDDAEQLKELVREYTSDYVVESELPEGVIAPHAGYRYSGKTAGKAYAYVKNGRELYKRVIILGTPHRMYFSGIAASSAECFRTPLGDVEVDTDAVQFVRNVVGGVRIIDEAFEEEHSVEVQIPFLQETIDDFKIVPLLAGPGSTEGICRIIELLQEESRLLTVASSDLSHFLSDAQARVVDAQTSEILEGLAFEGLEGKRACGVYAIQGLLCYARKHGFKVKTVHLSNSGEESGDFLRVVGYGAYVILRE